jgi:hypothetical protein
MSTCESPFTASFNLAWNGSGYVGQFQSQIPQGKAVRVTVFLTSSFIGVSPNATSFVQIGGVIVDQFQGSGPAGPYYIRSTDTFTVFTTGLPQGLSIGAGLYGDMVPVNSDIVFPQVRSIVSSSSSPIIPLVWYYPTSGSNTIGITTGPFTAGSYTVGSVLITSPVIPINVITGSPLQNQPYYLHGVSVDSLAPVYLSLDLSPVSGNPTIIDCTNGWTSLEFSINSIATVVVRCWPSQSFTVPSGGSISVNVYLYTDPVMVLGAVV